MTRSRNIRLYRACQRCRQRKLKCDPTVSPDGTPCPCQQCLRAGSECLQAGSRRGGDYSRFRRPLRGRSTSDRRVVTPRSPAVQAGHEQGHQKDPEDPIYAELTNPGDALQILARIAANNLQLSKQTQARPYPGDGLSDSRAYDSVHLPLAQPTLSEMEILVLNVLGTEKVGQLLHRYYTNYHTYYPLVPNSILSATDLRKVAVEEPFLLGVVLIIACKDVYHDIHRQCLQCVKHHLLDILIAAPPTLKVGSVEGLLLLAEWVPYLQVDNACDSRIVPRSVSTIEDNMAWSLIGQAVRHSYLLRLDRASFRETNLDEPQELENRKRLAWMFVYIADRQISVRMGQSFWSRGPSLSTRFTANDFPSLFLAADAEHKYAHVLEASIELTQLLHNVHDILYASKQRRQLMVRQGDYSRYLDDFRCSLSSWQGRWDDLDASPKLDSTLHIFQQYVRLYANAFAFQSILSRVVQENCFLGEALSGTSGRTPSLFPDGILSSAEGAYVLEAIDAARNILMITTRMNPEYHLRFMPFRFLVYTVYSAVFLYKAEIFGALVRAEHAEIVPLVQRYIHVLEVAATDAGHVASRFASLLRRMWTAHRTSSSSATMNLMNGLPNQSDAAQDIIVAEPQVDHDAVLAMREQEEPVNFPTPEFDLFCPELSTWESELADLCMSAPELPM